MIRIDRPDVVVAAVDTSLGLPLVDYALQPQPGTPEVSVGPIALTALALPLERLRTVLRIVPATPVPCRRSCSSLRGSAGRCLCRATDPGKAAVPATLLVEVRRRMLLLASGAPDRSVRGDRICGRTSVTPAGWVGRQRSFPSRPLGCFVAFIQAPSTDRSGPASSGAGPLLCACAADLLAHRLSAVELRRGGTSDCGSAKTYHRHRYYHRFVTSRGDAWGSLAEDVGKALLLFAERLRAALSLQLAPGLPAARHGPGSPTPASALPRSGSSRRSASPGRTASPPTRWRSRPVSRTRTHPAS